MTSLHGTRILSHRSVLFMLYYMSSLLGGTNVGVGDRRSYCGGSRGLTGLG